jgi:hypothetical protein
VKTFAWFTHSLPQLEENFEKKTMENLPSAMAAHGMSSKHDCLAICLCVYPIMSARELGQFL